MRTFLGDAGWELPAGEAASSAHAAEYTGSVVHGCCIAICGPVDDERVQSGPSLVEQGPTGWGSDAHEALELGLGAVVKRAVLINDFVAVGLGLTVVPDEDLGEVTSNLQLLVVSRSFLRHTCDSSHLARRPCESRRREGSGGRRHRLGRGLPHRLRTSRRCSAGVRGVPVRRGDDGVPGARRRGV